MQAAAKKLDAAGKNAPHSLEEESRQLIEWVAAANNKRKADYQGPMPPHHAPCDHIYKPIHATTKIGAGGIAIRHGEAVARQRVPARGYCAQLATPLSSQAPVAAATSHSDGSSQDGPWTVAQRSDSVECLDFVA